MLLKKIMEIQLKNGDIFIWEESELVKLSDCSELIKSLGIDESSREKSNIIYCLEDFTLSDFEEANKIYLNYVKYKIEIEYILKKFKNGYEIEKFEKLIKMIDTFDMNNKIIKYLVINLSYEEEQLIYTVNELRKNRELSSITESGKLEEGIYYYKFKKFFFVPDIDSIILFVYNLCKENYSRDNKDFNSLSGENNEKLIYNLLKKIESEHYEICKWILNLDKINFEKIEEENKKYNELNDEISFHRFDLEELTIRIIGYCNLDFLTWFYNKYSELIDKFCRIDKLFYVMCDYGKLEMAQWIYGKYNIEKISDKRINLYNKRNLENIIESGNLEFLLWIESIGSINKFYESNINESTDEMVELEEDKFFDIGILVSICRKGYLEIFKWIFDRFQFEENRSHSIVYYVKKYTRYNKWCDDFYEKQLYILCFQLLIESCCNNHLDISEWISSREIIRKKYKEYGIPDNPDGYNEDEWVIIQSYKKKLPEVRKWFLEKFPDIIEKDKIKKLLIEE